MLLLALADGFLFGLHTALILFNGLGWIPRRTRRWNLITLLLTAGSWLVLGAIYGTGYCFLTDWQWRIRAARGSPESADTFVQLLVRTLTGWDAPPSLLNALTGALGAAALLASLALNARDLLRSRRGSV